MRKLVLAALLIVAPIAAGAQDMPTIDYNGALNDARTTGRMVRRAQARQPRRAPSAVAMRARAKCANKRRVAAGMSPVDARRFYALCARAGY